MPTIELPHATLNYHVTGPADSPQPPVVFIHPILTDGALWLPVAERLAAHGVRSFAPDWPMGSHRIPLPADADSSPRGVARLVLDLLEALDLSNVTLVGNDTGGAICPFILDPPPDADASRAGRGGPRHCGRVRPVPPLPLPPLF